MPPLLVVMEIRDILVVDEDLFKVCHIKIKPMGVLHYKDASTDFSDSLLQKYMSIKMERVTSKINVLHGDERDTRDDS